MIQRKGGSMLALAGSLGAWGEVGRFWLRRPLGKAFYVASLFEDINLK
jgi:hypothetical protein